MSTPQNIIVIGAGICGLSSAIWLRRAGHAVTLVDRDYPGAGASQGNAGLLAQWAIVPVNTPDLIPTAIKYLSNPRSPLFLQWSYLPRLLPWLWQFTRNATPEGARRMVEGLIPIVGDSVDQHRALVRGTPAEKWLATSDFAYAYPSRAVFEADSYGWEMKRAAGHIPEVIEGAAVQEVEPILGPATQCLALLKDHGHIRDPLAYMADLASVLQSEGGTYRRADVHDITLTDGRITSVVTDQGALPCDAAVLAAGIWSKPLMRKLGLKVPLEAERGYHLHFKGPSQMPRHPLMISRQIRGQPDGPRAALRGHGGIGRHHQGAVARAARSDPPRLGAGLPDLTYESVEEWMGFRPSTPDSLPLIGEIGGTGVHAAFGHQHIGLTAGPKTGRLVADMIDGRRPNIDLAPTTPTASRKA